MEILWEEEGFQFGFKRWQGWAVSKVLWDYSKTLLSFFTVKLLVLLVVGQTVCGLTVLRSDSIIVHKAWVRHAPENLHAKFHLHRLSGSSAKSINHPWHEHTQTETEMEIYKMIPCYRYWGTNALGWQVGFGHESCIHVVMFSLLVYKWSDQIRLQLRETDGSVWCVFCNTLLVLPALWIYRVRDKVQALVTDGCDVHLLRNSTETMLIVTYLSDLGWWTGRCQADMKAWSVGYCKCNTLPSTLHMYRVGDQVQTKWT